MKKLILIMGLCIISVGAIQAQNVDILTDELINTHVTRFESELRRLEHQDSILNYKLASITQNISEMQSQIRSLSRDNVSFQNTNSKLQSLVDSLYLQSQSQHKSIIDNIADIHDNNTKAIDQSSIELSSLVNVRSLLGGITLLLVVTAIGVIIFRQLRLYSNQKVIKEESLVLDEKLLKLLDAVICTNKLDQDHSLALKIADEIIRIETNLSRMDNSIKGYKQLAASVRRIKDNFTANGYELVDMLGKPYDERMKVSANFVSDDTLKEGEQIITGVIKPQINYKGQMIQIAQVTVSQN